ncbi:NADH-ubiquinone oxidoreductase [Acetobacter lambici]|uniref:NADH-ubiquinone oxidoreductase n=1 Tax=Acetobacter lambici TaxID=1332824 RepID=A0ABT1EZR2_9PROT|nr:NADH-ubiquinone oxidoreductase [Acetobacter lambici]MCP1242304.1 NADH-ubiquinone oxidoreductase [Acetobacter lambici]MCP1258420.1 NADH-ubiquinone oxidoreductase [Acetobacter lambici]NHO56787.1 NADH-ubiquinone oxidoreductase [Acetobacter lambici]
MRRTQPHTDPVHVLGASGRSGQAMCRALALRGTPVVPIVRNPARAKNLPNLRVANLEGPTGPLRAALADATRIVCTAHARHIPALLATAPATARLVCLGSTRKFTRCPDDHGNGVLLGEQAFLASGRSGVILHPTMIYGAQGENTVQRLAAVLRHLPFTPLPGGGRALVQPIWQGDVTACLVAALNRAWDGPHSMVIAGADALPYRQFAAMVAEAAGLAPRPTISLPVGLLMRLARMAAPVPGLPRVTPDEIRRLLENKDFDIAPMRAILAVQPIGLAEGLHHTFFDAGLNTPHG